MLWDFSLVCLLLLLISRFSSVFVYLWYRPVTLGFSGSPAPSLEPYSSRLYSSWVYSLTGLSRSNRPEAAYCFQYQEPGRNKESLTQPWFQDLSRSIDP